MFSPFKSPWHFDKFRQDEEGEFVKIVGQFEGDWQNEVELLRTKFVDKFVIKQYNTQGYNHAANKPSEGHAMEDLLNPYGDPSAVIFQHFKFEGYEEELPIIQKII